MSFEERLVNFSATAAADQSANQYRLMAYANQSGRALAQRATTGDRVIGVLQNNPVAGDTCTIAHSGVSKVVAGGTVTAGATVMTDSTGRAITYSGTTEYKVGVAMESAVVGQIFAVDLIPFGIS